MNEDSGNLLSLQEIESFSRRDLAEYHSSHVNPGFVRMLNLLGLDKQFVRAEGTRVWDSEGNRYLDCLGGFGALNFGHNHPEIIGAIHSVASLPNLLQSGLGPLEGGAAYNLAQIMPGDLSHTFFCNSGTEAVEGALKLARIATGRKSIVYCEHSFHGKSLGSLSVTGRRKYQDKYRPLMPECGAVPFGDCDQLEEILSRGNVAAFILEPVQGEGGINIAPPGYLANVREICSRFDTLLILDEIQTGFGRTGADFACQHEGIVPDIICTAKSLGGGVVPVGAFTTRSEIWNKAYGGLENCLLHTSTFGGNTRACAAVIAATRLLKQDELAEKAKKRGQYLLSGLQSLSDEYDIVKDVRGLGLLIGIEFNPPTEGLAEKLSGGLVNRISHEYLGAMVCGALHNRHRIITAYTLNNPNVIRLEPPLTITTEEIDELLSALDAVFRKRGFLGMALESTKTALGSFFRRE